MDALDRRTITSAPRGKIGLNGARLVGLLAWACIAAQVCCLHSQAQVSVGGRAKNFVAPVTDAQGRKSVLRGREVKEVKSRKGLLDVSDMQAETYRGQEKDMIVKAPQCLFDTKSNVATSSGALSIRTADERFSIEGESFRWQMGDSRLNSRLVISNRVHSLVRKRLMTANSGPGPNPSTLPNPITASPKSPAQPISSASTNEFIDIRSDHFEYESDRAVYRGKVRVQDTEGDLACEVLTVVFQGESGAPERIEAEQDVVLTQEGTRAMADKAIYTVGQDKDIVEFLGHAVWEAGGRQGSGEKVIFDRRARTVRAEEKAYLKLPRAVLGESGILSSGPMRAGNATNAAAQFVEVFSDLMNIQLPPTNGPVRQIIAEKNVLIVDPTQDGRALADRAVYEEATGILELTGTPLLETERRLVNGKTLRFDRTTGVFTAKPDAYVKLPFQAVASLSQLTPSAASAPAPRAGTNQFIEIWAQEFEYRTNLLQFRGHARANFLEGPTALGKLTCGSITIHYAEHVESMLAETNVELEQFVVPQAPEPVSRTVRCEQLRAQFTPEGRLEVAVADHGVTAEQEESRRGHPRPIITTVVSDRVTAYFSTLTNRVDRVVAEKDVVFRQDERIARGTNAVYTDATGLLELTGQPTATMPEGQITEAERLVWDRLHARLIGRGLFKSEWKRPPASTNQVTAPLLGAENHR